MSCMQKSRLFKLLFSVGDLIVEDIMILINEDFREEAFKAFMLVFPIYQKLSNPPGNFIIDVFNVLSNHKFEITET